MVAFLCSSFFNSSENRKTTVGSSGIREIAMRAPPPEVHSPRPEIMKSTFMTFKNF
jgi:hypothetical protein